MGFVGIQTGFKSAGRRRALRNTWMPSDPEGLRRLEESTGLAIRFVIGKTKDEAKMAEHRKEIAEYDDFILVDIEEEYSKLPYKTLAFFKAAYALYDSEFYAKADDDIYLRSDRLSLLLAKERSHSQTYLGCLKKGPVFTDPKLKWYEPLADLLGSEYFLHAYGPIYFGGRVVVDRYVPLACEEFAKLHKQELQSSSKSFNSTSFFWWWTLFKIKLWNHGLISGNTINKCGIILQNSDEAGPSDENIAQILCSITQILMRSAMERRISCKDDSDLLVKGREICLV